MTDPYRIRSPETWDAAREAYLSGLSAAEACVRFDLGLSAFRKRAREEGWRRATSPIPTRSTMRPTTCPTSTTKPWLTWPSAA